MTLGRRRKSVRERAVASIFEASAIAGRSHRVVFQGVHMLMGGTPGNDWEPGEQRQSVMVFIGRDLPRDVIEGDLRNALAKVARPA
jgi:G3E family GTPase